MKSICLSLLFVVTCFAVDADAALFRQRIIVRRATPVRVAVPAVEVVAAPVVVTGSATVRVPVTRYRSTTRIKVR